MSQAVRTLKVAKDNFDQVNTFNVNVGKRSPAKCSLRFYPVLNPKFTYHHYEIMKHSAVLKDSYTEADRAERERFATEKPLENGDTVEVDGNLFTVKVRGDYSDAAYLIPVVA